MGLQAVLAPGHFTGWVMVMVSTANSAAVLCPSRSSALFGTAATVYSWYVSDPRQAGEGSTHVDI